MCQARLLIRVAAVNGDKSRIRSAFIFNPYLIHTHPCQAGQKILIALHPDRASATKIRVIRLICRVIAVCFLGV